MGNYIKTQRALFNSWQKYILNEVNLVPTHQDMGKLNFVLRSDTYNHRTTVIIR